MEDDKIRVDGRREVWNPKAMTAKNVVIAPMEAGIEIRMSDPTNDAAWMTVFVPWQVINDAMNETE